MRRANSKKLVFAIMWVLHFVGFCASQVFMFSEFSVFRFPWFLVKLKWEFSRIYSFGDSQISQKLQNAKSDQWHEKVWRTWKCKSVEIQFFVTVCDFLALPVVLSICFLFLFGSFRTYLSRRPSLFCLGLLVCSCASVLLCFLASFVRSCSLDLLRPLPILQKQVATPSSPPCP